MKRRENKNAAAPPPPDFTPAGFFVQRTPPLPFDEFLAWGRARLQAVVERPEVREALS